MKIKTSPQDHQKKVIPILEIRPYIAWLWDMGTGKTWLGCYKISHILFNNQDAKVLVISPNTVTSVWKKEIKKHTFLKKFITLEGAKEKRLKLLNTPDKNIFIINFEGIQSVLPELQKIKWNLIIVDESHKIKNINAKQTKGVLSLSAENRMILTGTPVLNGYLDIFSQFLFLDRGKTFGTNFFEFRSKYFIDRNFWMKVKQRQQIMRREKDIIKYFPDWVIKPKHKKKIYKKMKKLCFRLKREDCLDLPTRIFHSEYIDMSAEQKKRTKQMARDCIIWLEKKEKAVTAQIAAVKSIRFSQITSGFLKTEDGTIFKMKENPKLKTLKSIVEEILYKKKNKIIIWAYFKYDIKLLKKELKKYNPVVLAGGVKNSQKVQDKFNNKRKYRILIAQPQSAGLGLTLTAANYTIYYSYNYSAGDYWQSLQRNYRKGSEIHKKIVCIKLKCKDSIDEVVFKNLKRKKKMANAILNYIQKGKT